MQLEGRPHLSYRAVKRRGRSRATRLGVMRSLAKATTTPQPSARALLENDRFARYSANHVHALFQVLTQGGERGARFKRLKLAH
jgi:hypothetical protein